MDTSPASAAHAGQHALPTASNTPSTPASFGSTAAVKGSSSSSNDHKALHSHSPNNTHPCLNRCTNDSHGQAGVGKSKHNGCAVAIHLGISTHIPPQPNTHCASPRASTAQHPPLAPPAAHSRWQWRHFVQIMLPGPLQFADHKLEDAYQKEKTLQRYQSDIARSTACSVLLLVANAAAWHMNARSCCHSVGASLLITALLLLLLPSTPGQANTRWRGPLMIAQYTVMWFEGGRITSLPWLASPYPCSTASFLAQGLFQVLWRSAAAFILEPPMQGVLAAATAITLPQWATHMHGGAPPPPSSILQCAASIKDNADLLTFMLWSIVLPSSDQQPWTPRHVHVFMSMYGDVLGLMMTGLVIFVREAVCRARFAVRAGAPYALHAQQHLAAAFVVWIVLPSLPNVSMLVYAVMQAVYTWAAM